MLKNDVTVAAASHKIEIVGNLLSKRAGPSLGSIADFRRQDDVLPSRVSGARSGTDAGWNTMG
jgi:hypothetical protein